jgi:hypothetical protein
MNTTIEIIKHDSQRYPTVGDYWIDEKGVKQIRIYSMGNEDYEFLVTIHELIEEHLTRRRGLSEKEISDFDLIFEKERESGTHAHNDEPGFDPRSPYLKEHTIATGIEMMLAGHMGIDWNSYDKTVMEL